MMSTRNAAPAGITFINARLREGRLGTLRVVGTQIADLDSRPEPADLVVNLHGDRLVPGLINAHDHLQLNSLPPPLQHAPYHQVQDWISDVESRLETDPAFAAMASVKVEDRLLIGGLKNLLSGVTTVAHHDPLYPFLSGSDYPVSVVRDYGWSHSLYMDGEEKTRASFKSTPASWPWIVHAAEGVNEDAGREFDRLDALGCIKANTLLVHGIALDVAQRRRLGSAGAGLIWCPSSNLRLFGRTAAINDLLARGCVALGTDSRLSGEKDLLGELKIARTFGLTEEFLEKVVTGDSARLLRLRDRGSLQSGLRADLLVLPAGESLSSISRSDLRLVMVAGAARYGDSDYAGGVAPQGGWSEVLVDGIRKVLDSRIVKLLSMSRTSEFGLEVANVTGRAA
jgi:cytosine/adenosine deaminase-related metal-dependent hydrolase